MIYARHTMNINRFALFAFVCPIAEPLPLLSLSRLCFALRFQSVHLLLLHSFCEFPSAFSDFYTILREASTLDCRPDMPFDIVDIPVDNCNFFHAIIFSVCFLFLVETLASK